MENNSTRKEKLIRGKKPQKTLRDKALDFLELIFQPVNIFIYKLRILFVGLKNNFKSDGQIVMAI